MSWANVFGSHFWIMARYLIWDNFGGGIVIVPSGQGTSGRICPALTPIVCMLEVHNTMPLASRSAAATPPVNPNTESLFSIVVCPTRLPDPSVFLVMVI